MSFENPQVLSTANCFAICSAASQHSTLRGALWDHQTSSIVELSAKRPPVRQSLDIYHIFIIAIKSFFFFFFLVSPLLLHRSHLLA